MNKLTSRSVGRGSVINAVNGDGLVLQFLKKAQYAMDLAISAKLVSADTKEGLRAELRAMKKKLPSRVKYDMLGFFNPSKFNWALIKIHGA